MRLFKGILLSLLITPALFSNHSDANNIKKLDAGMGIMSENGSFELLMQIDGNLVLYKTHAPHLSCAASPSSCSGLWSSATRHADRLAMQSNGNLVIYDAPNNEVVWTSQTPEHPGAILKLVDDGRLVIYDSAGQKEIWATAPTPIPPHIQALVIVEHARRGDWYQVNLFNGDVNAVAPNGDTALSIAIPQALWSKQEFERQTDEGSDGVYYINVKNAIYNLLNSGAKFSEAQEDSMRQLNDGSINHLLDSFLPNKTPLFIEIALEKNQKLPAGNWQVRFYDKSNQIKQTSPLNLQENISVPDMATGFRLELNNEIKESMSFIRNSEKMINYVLKMTEIVECSNTLDSSSKRKTLKESSYITFIPRGMPEGLGLELEQHVSWKWAPILWNQQTVLFGGSPFMKNIPKEDIPMRKTYHARAVELTQSFSLNGAFDHTVTIDCKKGFKYSLTVKKTAVQDQGDL